MNTIKILILLVSASYLRGMQDTPFTKAERFEYCQNTSEYSTLDEEQCDTIVKNPSDEAKKYVSMLKANNYSSKARLAQTADGYMNTKSRYKKERKNSTGWISFSDVRKKELNQLRKEKNKALLNFMLVREIYNYTASEPNAIQRSFFKSALRNRYRKFVAKSLYDTTDRDSSVLALYVMSLEKSTFGRNVFDKIHTRLHKKK